MINSLINFGVPGISDERSGPVQPIMGNRFRVIFYNFAGVETPYILTQHVKSIQLPSITFAVNVSNENGEYKASNAEWAHTNIRFLDEITGKLFRSILQQAKLQESDKSTFTMNIDLMDSQTVIRRYTHENCEVTSIQPVKDLDYSLTEALEFYLTIKYKNVNAKVPVTKFEGFESL